jgi:5-carboxymethyl-2-hydroxymuconate isomerase
MERAKIVMEVEERMRSGKIEEEVRKWKEEDDKNEDDKDESEESLEVKEIQKKVKEGERKVIEEEEEEEHRQRKIKERKKEAIEKLEELMFAMEDCKSRDVLLEEYEMKDKYEEEDIVGWTEKIRRKSKEEIEREVKERRIEWRREVIRKCEEVLKELPECKSRDELKEKMRNKDRKEVEEIE